MDLKINNGSVVNRVLFNGSAELIAGFQYESDAIAFATMKVTEEAERDYRSDYVVSCTLTGKLTIIKAAPPKAKAA